MTMTVTTDGLFEKFLVFGLYRDTEKFYGIASVWADGRIFCAVPGRQLGELTFEDLLTLVACQGPHDHLIITEPVLEPEDELEPEPWLTLVDLACIAKW